MKQVQIDRQFLSRLQGLKWEDICFAVKQNFIHPLGAVDFAVKVIESSSTYSKNELELASKTEADPLIDIVELIDKICGLVHETPELCEKWLFLSLYWLYINRCKFDDPLDVLEGVYTDFDYPDAIKHLIRYMPNEDGRIIDFKKEWLLYLNASRYRSYLGLQALN
jgi:hypothetical protein